MWLQAFPDTISHPQYRTLVSTTQHIIQSEGAGTLFAGMWPRMFRIVCAGKLGMVWPAVCASGRV